MTSTWVDGGRGEVFFHAEDAAVAVPTLRVLRVKNTFTSPSTTSASTHQSSMTTRKMAPKPGAIFHIANSDLWLRNLSKLRRIPGKNRCDIRIQQAILHNLRQHIAMVECHA